MEKNQENQNPDGINQNQEQVSNKETIGEESSKIEISKNFLINLFIVLFGIVLILFEVVFIRNTENTFGVIETTITTVTIVLLVFLLLLLNNKRMMTLREELLGWWRYVLKALISGPMVSLYLAAAGGYIGYQITTWLSREKIIAEGVIVKQKPVIVDIPKDLLKDIQVFDSYEFNPVSERNNDLESSATLFDDSKLISILKSLGKYYSRLNELRDKIISDNLTENYSDALNSIPRKYKISNDTLKALDDSDYFFDFYRQDFTIGQKKEIEKELTRAKIKIRDLIEALIELIEDELSSENTGFLVDILVSNSGGTQAVIRNKAIIVLTQSGDQRIMMKRNEIKQDESLIGDKTSEGNENFKILEAKGFTSLQLHVEDENIYNTNTNIIDAYKAYQLRQDFEVILFDMKNNEVGPFKFKLRNDLENDPNRKLKQIMKEYKTKLI
jgi:hypothetical protein